MKKLDSISALRSWRENVGADRLGLVATMGALHDGHRKLIKESIRENAQTIVSIFVNPTQFNDPRDFAEYPSPLEKDLTTCEAVGVDAVFLPKPDSLYPDDFVYRIVEVENGDVLEGESRPGHFVGVLTVVLKLFLLVSPNRAYFGEKDWQQLQLVRGMAKAFLLPVEVVGVPTVREEDGLAMSSRNVRLSESARIRAPEFYRVLTTAMDCAMARHELESLGFDVEYIDERDGRRLGAVQLDGIRLIDNVPAPS